MKKIDINCDVGEGVGNEAQLMPYISSCNIACGAHAGSIEIIDKVITLAVKNHVKVGAHPSYPDKENFGRKVLDMPLEDLEESLADQIKLLERRCQALTGKTINHVKAHGALYNTSAKDETIANVVLNAFQQTVPKAKLYVPHNSIIEKIALQKNVNVCYEIFADRNYEDDLSLVPRSQSNALLTEKQEVAEHVLIMVNDQKVKTISGKHLPIQANTCCVHGDNENAIEIVKFLHQSLTEKGIIIG